MSHAADKYLKSVRYCLNVLSCSGEKDADFMDAFADYCDLYEKVKGAHKRGLVTDDQCQAIKTVFAEMAELTEHENTLKLHTNQSYLTAPEWNATKAAARKALPLFK